MKHKSLVILAALIVLGGFLLTQRYTLLNTRAGIVKIDNWTGNTWRLYNGMTQWEPVKSAPSTQQVSADITDLIEPVASTPAASGFTAPADEIEMQVK